MSNRPLGVRLAALSIGQVISWGILYYTLIVAAPAIADETGWGVATVTLCFSGGLIVSAAAGIVVGRWLDDRGPRLVMTLGAVVGSLGLVIVSAASDLVVFTLGWVVCGLAQAAVLYQAAFTVIARRHGDSRRSAMTILTLAGGLASTVFAPIVAGLLTAFDWRATFLILAGALLVLTVPLHWFFLERAWAPLPPAHAGEAVHHVGAVIRTRRFWMLEVSMVALAAALFSVTLAIIPLYMEKGMTYELAAWALGLLGAGQVIGRLLYVAVPHRTEPWIPLAITSSLAVVLLALMGLVPGPPWLLIGIGIIAGAVRGAQTLVQGSAVADRWGTRNYGSINGVFAAPITAISALGPALGPVIAVAVGGYSAMALVMAGVAMIAVITARFS
ncbi:MFS family permease [Agromyces hippuratus]|uniref:MFS family permease n=1 Tax=Agromyces hippuratus TaxID=286438 RepID=A0A852WSE8_9MICO|nr:MFS transporter [Agromyces hippuratus]NYG19260.1 MFS family permease [Agromyces hippuratus]